MAGVPLMRRRRPGCALRPPKRLFGLVGDVAPGQADIVQVAFAPAPQFEPLVPPLLPKVEGLTELGQNAGPMLIRHRLMCAGGHRRLQKITFKASISAPNQLSTNDTLCRFG